MLRMMWNVVKKSSLEKMSGVCVGARVRVWKTKTDSAIELKFGVLGELIRLFYRDEFSSNRICI